MKPYLAEYQDDPNFADHLRKELINSVFYKEPQLGVMGRIRSEQAGNVDKAA